MNKGLIALFFISLFIFSCGKKSTQEDQSAEPAQFELLRKEATGLDFENVLKQSEDFNVFTYMYYFNGGGLAAGDFNQDGLIDLYFTSNMGPNKMFLNEGDLKFRDVTEEAGVAGIDGGWTTGASVVDINNDGLLDIYVSQMGDYLTIKGQNQFFICQGIENGVPVYEDMAIAYGLDLIVFGTQSTFFDYDRDGDLDFFQLNHSLHANGTFGQKQTFVGTQHPQAGDRLYRNDGPVSGDPKGVLKFTEVTQEAGIKSTVIGYGLGIVTGDVNNDGWPDIYIGNDFHENDYLYLNQKDGTFKEVIPEVVMHTSRFSMGVDMADINNDGWNDVISLDMLPEDREILKASLGEDDYAMFHFKLEYGYNHQFARNNLQLNLGPDGDNQLNFSEIGMYSGIHATDWSWGPLFLDFDNDGQKDLFISNGIPRRMNDIDYVNFRSGSDLMYKGNTYNLEESDLFLIDSMPKIKLPNKFFHNNGKLRFDDWTGRVNGASDTYSSANIAADLDNDGDLDIVVNNIEDEPFIYKNLQTESLAENETSKHISLKLEGPPANVNAIGTRVVVRQKNARQTYEHFPVRGYQSSCERPLHIGLGDSEVVGVDVIWPDGTFSSITPERGKQTEVKWQADLPKYDFSKLNKQVAPAYDFEKKTAPSGLDFVHQESDFVEFHRERLIPQMTSTDGPALAVGDVNGDGLDDVFFGAAKFIPSELYVQNPNGSFAKMEVPIFRQDSLLEDVDAHFIDLDNDGDLDLAVAAGGNEFWGEHFALQQRVYLNDGTGQLTRIEVPAPYMTAACVLPADFDGDGLTDLFFGARTVPWKYGEIPESALLKNLGNGKFKNVTSDDMKMAGLVKNGHWADTDSDGDLDLVLALEWAPVTIFENESGTFSQKEINGQTGWWNFVLAHDFDGDGDVDILAGNTGENSRFQPTKEEPVKMYVNDFDDNDQVEQVLTYFLDGVETPFANYMEITKQLVGLKKQYLYAKDFAKASLDDLFGKTKMAEAKQYSANTFSSMYFENVGNGYAAHPLPAELQFSTLKTAHLTDLDEDGKMEIIVAGNFYECNIEMGRYDADYGHVLRISDGGKMEVFPLGDVRVKGQVRRIREVEANGERLFIFAKNDDRAEVLKITRKDVQ